MALATSTVEEYRNDPRFMQQLEMRHREDLVGLNLYAAKFDPQLKKGRQIKVNREFKLDASSTDGYPSISYQTLNTDGVQTFTVDDAAHVAVQVNDTDDIQSVYDLHSQVTDTGMFAINKYLDEQAFSDLQANGALETAAVDISGTESDASKGNKLYAALMDANQSLDAIGLPMADRKFVMAPEFFRYLKDADKLTMEVDPAFQNTMNGRVPMTIDGILKMAMSINLKKTTNTYTLYAKGAIEVGKMHYADCVVDDNGGGALTEPKAGDYFTNNSKTVTIRGVKKVSATEYQLYLDRPIETQINDNGSITVTGAYQAYIPVCQGVVGAAAIQSFPGFESLRDKDAYATYIRMQTVFDFFVTAEATTKLVHIPVTYRTSSGGTWT